MKDQNYQAIVNALDLLVTGRPVKSNGKITGVNLALEANISKATLYRYFDDYPALREAYNLAHKKTPLLTIDAPETIQQAHQLLKDEVRRLRTELAETKRNAEHANKLKAHQIYILWSDNDRLQDEVKRLKNQIERNNNVIPIFT